MNTNDLLNRLENDILLGDPFLSCNVSRNNLTRVVQLVRELTEEVAAQKVLLADYMCVMSYQQMKLDNNIPKIPDYRATYGTVTKEVLIGTIPKG